MLSEIAWQVKEIRKAFAQGNVIELRIQSNKAINNAAFESDKLLAQVSLLAYALHKMSIKTHITQNPRWPKIKNAILHSLDNAIGALEQKDIKEFELELEEMKKRLIETDQELGNYAANIYEKARIKMASSAYGIGLSLSQAAALTGAEKKQLLNYIGITKMHDEVKEAKGIAARAKELKKVLWQ